MGGAVTTPGLAGCNGKTARVARYRVAQKQKVEHHIGEGAQWGRSLAARPAGLQIPGFILSGSNALKHGRS